MKKNKAKLHEEKALSFALHPPWSWNLISGKLAAILQPSGQKAHVKDGEADKCVEHYSSLTFLSNCISIGPPMSGLLIVWKYKPHTCLSHYC